MKRTNIYLDESQTHTLDELARLQKISRAELIRRIIEKELDGERLAGLADTLQAIDESFGALAQEIDSLNRGRADDDRARHLQRMWER